MVGKQILITGIVQAVGYRYFAKIHADALGLKGWAKNQDDGSVLVQVFGEQKIVDMFIVKLRIGPARAKVENLDVTDVEISAESLQNEFEIRRD